MFYLFNVIFVIGLGMVEGILGIAPLSSQSMLANLYVIAVFIPFIAVSVRRLHDTDRSGWWLLLGFVPFIGTIVLVVFFALDSKPGQNQYGPNPKETAEQQGAPY